MGLARSKNNKKTTLSNKAHNLWKEVCWEMYGDRCEICGVKAGAIHHLIFKSKSRNLAYDVLNGIPVCEQCHSYLHHFVGPKTNEEYMDIIFKKRGEWQREYLTKNTSAPSGYTVTWLKEQIEYLKEIKESLKIK